MSLLRGIALTAALAVTATCGKGKTENKDDRGERESKPRDNGHADSKPVELINASFDDGEPGLHGWETSIGANNDPAPGSSADTTSSAAITPGTGRGGSAALELTGDASTAVWQMVGQTFATRPGQQLIVSFATRSKGLVEEGKQFVNANAVVVYADDSGKRLGLEASTPLTGSTPWQQRTLVTSPAPAGTARATVSLFSSMTGTMWVDDVSVVIRDVRAWSRAGAGAAWDHLVSRVAATYPFSPVDSGRVQWEKAADELRAKATEGDRDKFVATLLEALRPLGDAHVTVKVDGHISATVGPHETETSWNFGAVKAVVKDTILSEDGFGVARLKAGLGYVLIGSWARGRGPIDRVLAAMERLSDVRGWIIDVRVNQGGDDQWATLVASRFATQPAVFAKLRYRVGDGYGPWNERVIGPSADGAPDQRKVVVLQSPLCMSSNEGFIMMMRALPSVTTVGLTTRGASRNPGPIYVASDIEVMSSRWEAALPDGTLIEGVGIAPDVLVDEPASAYANADPTLDKAIELLR